MANQQRIDDDLQTTALNSSLVAGGIGVGGSGDSPSRLQSRHCLFSLPEMALRGNSSLLVSIYIFENVCLFVCSQ